MAILETINNCNDVKKLNINELKTLASEIRELIIETTKTNGGHLASNLGTVDLIVALFYVFDFEKDKMIFDVGHQSYAYKILTDRFKNFSSLRSEDGISGFPDGFESKYDAFTTGHAGTSISASLGYCFSRDYLGEDYYVVNLVGDASFFNGENLEAITYSDKKPNKFLCIFNDNGMSIDKNRNAVYKFVSKVTISKRYNSFNNFLGNLIGRTWLGKLLMRFKLFIKRSLSLYTILDNVGVKYVGVFDGHDIKTLIKILKNIKDSSNATLLHLNTKKGKGYYEAEENSSKYHGVSANLEKSNNEFSNSVSQILIDLKQNENSIVAITAGMKDGVGLTEFADVYPNSFIDVGIAEECAVTLAGGMAKGGLKPILFMYSTFLQRGYDQILHDICLQNLPVIICIDRAGFVGSDGKTHQGLFDISYLSHLPNLKIFAPKNTEELKDALILSLKLNSPVCIRYPNGVKINLESVIPLSDISWEYVKKGGKNTILAVGPRMNELALKVYNEVEDVTVINARTVKPLDASVLLEIKDSNIITLEENAKLGGFGSMVVNFYKDKGIDASVKVLAVEDEFIPHATVESQLKLNGFTVENIKKLLKLI